MCLHQEPRWTLPAATLCVTGGLVGQVSSHQIFYKYIYWVLNDSTVSHHRSSHVHLLFDSTVLFWVFFFITYASALLMTNLSVWIIAG